MKMTPTMPTSIKNPRASLTLMSSDLDLLVLGQELPGSPGPETLHELGDALQEQHEERQRDDTAQRPQDRRPGAGAGALVDRERVEEIVDRDVKQHRHGRQEKHHQRQAVDHALR